jgi:acylphosphatase
MTQHHVIFTGHVQGVGFRFTARDFARDLDIVGWVRNLPDGSVEMLAEGEEAALTELLSRLKAHFRGYIHNASVQNAPASGSPVTFEIVF